MQDRTGEAGACVRDGYVEFAVHRCGFYRRCHLLFNRDVGLDYADARSLGAADLFGGRIQHGDVGAADRHGCASRSKGERTTLADPGPSARHKGGFALERQDGGTGDRHRRNVHRRIVIQVSCFGSS